MILETIHGALNLSEPRIMGVLNVTPDSFSDGGKYYSLEQALSRAETLVQEGADIIDIGGESTRPGSAPVSQEEEIERVVPVLKELRRLRPRLVISLDTSKPAVARAGLTAGASLINDVRAAQEPGMTDILKEFNAPVVLMHMQGTPRVMQENPVYQDVVAEISSFFRSRVSALRQAGYDGQILVDPGVGFGKTVEHNINVLAHLENWRAEHPLVVGTSRKSFIAKIWENHESAGAPPKDRLEGSLATALWAVNCGAHIIRVHDVKAHRRAIELWLHLQKARFPREAFHVA